MERTGRILALLLVLVLGFSLVTACNSGQGGSTTAPKAADPTTAPTGGTPETTDASSETSGEQTPAPGGVEPHSKWPEKPVNIIVPYAPGGDSDMNARTLAEGMQKKSGGTFIITNISGNGGATGALEALSAPADGYTILFHHTGFVVNQLTKMTTFTYDTVDFGAIIGRNAGNIITMSSKHGIKDLQGLIDYTKEHPGELKIAANTGATTHATALMLRKLGVDAKMVDTGGSAERISMLLGGHVDIIINPINTIADYLKTGELVGLCTDNDVESATLRDQYNLLPGASQGFDLGLPFYYTLMFPKGTDPAIIAKLNVLAKDVIENDKEYQDVIYKAYLQEPVYYDNVEGLKIMKDAYDKLSTLDFGN